MVSLVFRALFEVLAEVVSEFGWILAAGTVFLIVAKTAKGKKISELFPGDEA